MQTLEPEPERGHAGTSGFRSGNSYSRVMGNYWGSASTGTDTNGDGIGDVLFTIPDGLGTAIAPLTGLVAESFNSGVSTSISEFPTMALPVLIIGAPAFVLLEFRKK